MQILRRIFGSGAGSKPSSDGAIHLYVRCDRCGAPVHVRIDPRNDLAVEYGENDDAIGYRLTKEIMDARCFLLMRATIEYSRERRETARELEGGTFISQQEYAQLLEQSEHRSAGS